MKTPRFAQCFALTAAASTVLVMHVTRATADAPACWYEPDTDTALDIGTGLTWQRVTDGVERDWDTAQAYCANLVLGGSSDWRLPTITELATIVDESRSEPAIDMNVFPGTPPQANFWTSTTSAANAAQAWGIYFYYGEMNPQDKTVIKLVRCVR